MLLNLWLVFRSVFLGVKKPKLLAHFKNSKRSRRCGGIIIGVQKWLCFFLEVDLPPLDTLVYTRQYVMFIDIGPLFKSDFNIRS